MINMPVGGEPSGIITLLHDYESGSVILSATPDKQF